jgi:hypothetical protein
MVLQGKKALEKNPYGGGEIVWWIGAALLGAVGVVASVTAIFSAVDAVNHIVNPSYYALMDLAKLIGK